MLAVLCTCREFRGVFAAGFDYSQFPREGRGDGRAQKIKQRGGRPRLASGGKARGRGRPPAATVGEGGEAPLSEPSNEVHVHQHIII